MCECIICLTDDKTNKYGEFKKSSCHCFSCVMNLFNVDIDICDKCNNWRCLCGSIINDNLTEIEFTNEIIKHKDCNKDVNEIRLCNDCFKSVINN